MDGGGRGRGVNGAPASKVGETPAQTGSLKRSNCFCPLDATALELLNVRKAPLDFCDCSREETLIPMKVQLLEELSRRAAELAAAKRGCLGEASAQAQAAIGALPSVRRRRGMVARGRTAR